MKGRRSPDDVCVGEGGSCLVIAPCGDSVSNEHMHSMG